MTSNNLITVTPSEVYNPSQDRPIRYTNSFTEQDMSENSLDAYRSDWEDFCIWCNQNGRKFMPADPHDVADYLEDRAKHSWIGISGKKRQLKEKQPLKME